MILATHTVAPALVTVGCLRVATLAGGLYVILKARTLLRRRITAPKATISTTSSQLAVSGVSR